MGGKCRSRQVRWVPGRGWEREDGDLLGDHVLHMYLLGERTRWPEGTVSLRSGTGIKSHSGIGYQTEEPTPLLLSEGYRDPQATL